MDGIKEIKSHVPRHIAAALAGALRDKSSINIQSRNISVSACHYGDQIHIAITSPIYIEVFVPTNKHVKAIEFLEAA